MHEDLIPDLSLGTHFFNELVEAGILYLGYFSQRKENLFNEDLILQQPNAITALYPHAKQWFEAIHLLDCSGDKNPFQLFLNADTINQKAVLYLG